jgi:hypothetical protein
MRMAVTFWAVSSCSTVGLLRRFRVTTASIFVNVNCRDSDGPGEVCMLCSNSCFSPDDRSMRRVFELSSDKNNIDCIVLIIIRRTV